MGPWWGAYVGLAFGEGPGEVTCWGLVRAVLRARAGVELPAYGEIAARDLAAVARAMREGQAAPWAERWEAVAVPGPLDVVLMRSGRGGQGIVHVGVMVEAGRMLHVEAATDSVVVPLTLPTVASRIAGFRRWRG